MLPIVLICSSSNTPFHSCPRQNIWMEAKCRSHSMRDQEKYLCLQYHWVPKLTTGRNCKSSELRQMYKILKMTGHIDAHSLTRLSIIFQNTVLKSAISTIDLIFENVPNWYSGCEQAQSYFELFPVSHERENVYRFEMATVMLLTTFECWQDVWYWWQNRYTDFLCHVVDFFNVKIGNKRLEDFESKLSPSLLMIH